MPSGAQARRCNDRARRACASTLAAPIHDNDLAMPTIPPRYPVVLSILAALLTLGMKAGAAWLTGSVGLLSDAAESLINLFAAVTAYLSLCYAARPIDESHTYGHEKIE